MRACSTAWSERLSAVVDGEAGPVERAAVEAHVARCDACAGALEAYRGLGEALRDVPVEVPPGVVERARRLSPRRPARGRRALGAALVAVAMLLAWLAPSVAPGGLDEALAVEVSGHHFRAFARARPCDFESEDPAAVERWLEEAFGYAVEVPVVEGATLLGARRCRLHGVLTAAVLYRIGDEALTIFLPQAETKAAAQALDFAGGGVRCAGGALGETICAAPGPSGVTVAVAALDPEALMATLPR